MVYVDHLKDCVPNARWPWRKSAHLFADSEQELHNFASAIGLKRQWFQKNSKLDHYDITFGKLKQAISNGAVQISDSEMVARFKRTTQWSCDICGVAPLVYDTIILNRVNPLGQIPAVWRCQHCIAAAGMPVTP